MEGPGRYVPDETEGITRPQDLPQPRIQVEDRDRRHCDCPTCGRRCPRRHTYRRKLHDLGDARPRRPVDLDVRYSQHYCCKCRRWFQVDLTDLAPPRGLYTHRVMEAAVAAVVEDGLPYRTASWRLWRDHRVFVPFATIQNWVEAAGKKSPTARGRRVPQLGSGRLLRVPEH